MSIWFSLAYHYLLTWDWQPNVWSLPILGMTHDPVRQKNSHQIDFHSLCDNMEIKAFENFAKFANCAIAPEDLRHLFPGRRKNPAARLMLLLHEYAIIQRFTFSSQISFYAAAAAAVRQAQLREIACMPVGQNKLSDNGKVQWGRQNGHAKKVDSFRGERLFLISLLT